jgi:hypothetical protein
MKKTLIILFIVTLSSGFLTAQDKEAGDSKRPKYLLGGTLNFTKHKLENGEHGNLYYDDFNGFSISLEGKFGVATGKHFYLGIVAGYTHHDNGFYTKYSQFHWPPVYITVPVIVNIYNFAPFLRFHGNLSGKLGYYADAMLGVEFSSDFVNTGSGNGFQKLYTDLSIGANLKLSEKFGLEMMIFSINYSEQEKDQYEEKLKILKTEFIFSNPTMGLVFYF